MQPKIEQPDVTVTDSKEHYDGIIGRVRDINDGGGVKSYDAAGLSNPVLLSYSPGLMEIEVSTINPDVWDDEDIIDELCVGLCHEFMHELLYELGDHGELTGETGMGHPISKQYDHLLKQVLDERDLITYARSD